MDTSNSPFCKKDRTRATYKETRSGKMVVCCTTCGREWILEVDAEAMHEASRKLARP